MKNDKEIVGTLLGFDDFVSILFENGFTVYVYKQFESSYIHTQ